MFPFGLLTNEEFLGNTLPMELRNAPSKILFKTKLKIHLLNKVDR